jgi:hypothetical protein
LVKSEAILLSQWLDIRFAKAVDVNLETGGRVSKRHFLWRGQGWKQCGDGTNLGTTRGKEQAESVGSSGRGGCFAQRRRRWSSGRDMTVNCWGAESPVVQSTAGSVLLGGLAAGSAGRHSAPCGMLNGGDEIEYVSVCL